MTDFTISDELAEQLKEIAQRENRSIDEIFEDALREYADTHVETSVDDEPLTEAVNGFLAIAQAADELGERSKEGDISERSREILDNDFPEYLMKRMRGDYSDV